ncbi:MAG: adenylate/guanylate cyclase domain-containing protein [Myxococcota bacterium]
MPARERTEDRVNYLTALCRTVPYHIVEAVLDNPVDDSVKAHAFDGTVLFADLVGFTAMCERLASEGPKGLSRLAKILNGLFSNLLDEAIFPYSGYVVAFGGDSLTAFFRGKQHAERAAAAALTAERLVYGEVGRLIGGKSRELMLRVGLATGEVRLPLLGDIVQRAVVCAGEPAHRALALQQAAEPNTIRIDKTTLEILGNVAEVVDRHGGAAVLRGLRKWPASVPIVELGQRVRDRVEEKISLLEPFIPAPLAGRLRTTPLAWRFDGELRTVVISFTEIWGVDQMENRAAVALDVSRSVLRAVRKYGGQLTKADLASRGHRVMVLFGLHRPYENDAERAVLAALETTARLKSFTAARGIDIVARTGIHTGKVYYGAIGSTYKHDITVVGDAVNVAARAAAAANPFEVVATDAVVDEMRADLQLSTREPILVKGKAVPLQLYVIHAPADGTAHYVSRRSKQRYLVGREAECRDVDAAVGSAFDGHGTVLGITGAHGVGKSAVLSRLIDGWSMTGSTGLLGRCRYATRSIPLAPVITMFNRFLGLTSRDNEAQRRERVRRGLMAFGLDRGAPELIALLQPVRRADGSTEALIDLADTGSRGSVLDSIVEFISKRIKQEPLLYVLEDLHLADTLTLALTERLAHVARDKPFLFVATYQPEPALDALRQIVHQELLIREMSSEAVEALVKHELSAETVDPGLLGFICQRSGGNPGHVIEIVRFLTERGLLHVRAGIVGPAEPGMRLLEDVVPTKLANVALARLDELGAIERRVLRTASAIGRRFDRGLLEETSASELGTEGLGAAVDALEGRGVIMPSSHEQHGYMFRDSVTRAVAYGTIPESDRRGIHERIADALEGGCKGKERELAAVVAMHRERAGQLSMAATWYERAIDVALRGGLDHEVRDLSERWEKVVDALPENDKPEPKRRAQVALLRFVAASRQGSAAETLRLGRWLTALHWASLAAPARAVVDFWLGLALVMLGKPEKARVRLERVYEHSDDPGLRSDAARTLARMLRYQHESEKSDIWLARALDVAGDDAQRKARAELEAALARAEVGEIPEAATLLERVRAKAEEHNNVALLADAALALGRTQLQLRAFEDARDSLEQALDSHRHVGRWREEAVDLVWLGQTYLWDGRPEEARPHFEKALALAQEIGDEVVTGGAMVHLGAAIAWTEDPERGAKMCEEGSRRAIRAGVRPIEVEADLHMLRMAIALSDPDAIAAALKRCEVQSRHICTPLLQRALEDLRQQADHVLPTRESPAI